MAGFGLVASWLSLMNCIELHQIANQIHPGLQKWPTSLKENAAKIPFQKESSNKF